MFVLSFCQFGRNGFPPLAVEEADILSIDPATLFRCWIGTGNIEITTLHEVVIGVAAARLAAAGKPCAAVHRAPLDKPTMPLFPHGPDH